MAGLCPSSSGPHVALVRTMGSYPDLSNLSPIAARSAPPIFVLTLSTQLQPSSYYTVLSFGRMATPPLKYGPVSITPYNPFGPYYYPSLSNLAR